MSVHYKFKDGKRWETIGFDSAVISVLDLKRAIVQQLAQVNPDEKFNQNMIFTNAQTGERYVAENFLIPKNTSVDVRRVPASADTIARIHESPVVTILSQVHPIPSSSGPTSDTPSSAADDELRRLEEVINQPHYASGVRHTKPGLLSDLASAFDAPAPTFAPTLPQRPEHGGRPQRPQFARSGRPRLGYICHRCQNPGHYIQDCPTNGNTEFNFQRPKPGTGIPLSMLRPVENGQGAYRLEDGTFANIEPNHRAFAEAFSAHDRAEQKIAMERAAASAHDLTCLICKKLYDDPVVISCCYTSFCRKCITDTTACPVCHEEISDASEMNCNSALVQRVALFLESNHQDAAADVPPPQESKPAPPKESIPVIERAPIPIYQSSARFDNHQQHQQLHDWQSMPPLLVKEKIPIVHRPVEVKQRHVVDEHHVIQLDNMRREESLRRRRHDELFDPRYGRSIDGHRRHGGRPSGMASDRRHSHSSRDFSREERLRRRRSRSPMPMGRRYRDYPLSMRR